MLTQSTAHCTILVCIDYKQGTHLGMLTLLRFVQLLVAFLHGLAQRHCVLVVQGANIIRHCQQKECQRAQGGSGLFARQQAAIESCHTQLRPQLAAPLLHCAALTSQCCTAMLQVACCQWWLCLQLEQPQQCGLHAAFLRID